MGKREKILIRTGYVEHLGYYAIKAYLPAKSTVVRGPRGKKHPGRSWQIIKRAFDPEKHQEQVEQLIKSGEYEKEDH